jgi:hypothetical protein
MNRSALRTRIRALTNINSTALLSDSQINEVLNEVHLEVCGSFQWPFATDSTTISVVAGDATYTLPVDATHVLLVSRTGNTYEPRQLQAISVFDADTLPQTTSNWPRYYTVEGLTLTLHPEPAANETITVRYLFQVEALDGDTDTPPFAEEFHPVYAYATAARLLAERGAPATKVKAMTELASSYVERMRRFYLTSSDHAPVSLGRRRWRR